jgi:hypothetical protein
MLSCSHNAYKTSEYQINRSISSQQFDIHPFLESLNRNFKIFPRLGNPRFYLFEHFTNRSLDLIDSLNAQNEFRSLLSIWASYKVMVEAGIYLNISFLVNQDSPEVSNLLKNLDDEMNGLKKRLNREAKIEDEEFALKYERKLLIKNLAKRISRDYKIFVKNEKDQKVIQFVLTSIDKLNTSEQSEIEYLNLISHPKFKRAKKLLSNLSLPENGGIDGLDESLDQVMSVQMSSELIQWLIQRELRN